jgi:hypothetical protein
MVMLVSCLCRAHQHHQQGCRRMSKESQRCDRVVTPTLMLIVMVQFSDTGDSAASLVTQMTWRGNRGYC